MGWDGTQLDDCMIGRDGGGSKNTDRCVDSIENKALAFKLTSFTSVSCCNTLNNLKSRGITCLTPLKLPPQPRPATDRGRRSPTIPL